MKALHFHSLLKHHMVTSKSRMVMLETMFLGMIRMFCSSRSVKRNARSPERGQAWPSIVDGVEMSKQLIERVYAMYDLTCMYSNIMLCSYTVNVN